MGRDRKKKGGIVPNPEAGREGQEEEKDEDGDLISHVSSLKDEQGDEDGDGDKSLTPSQVIAAKKLQPADNPVTLRLHPAPASFTICCKNTFRAMGYFKVHKSQKGRERDIEAKATTPSDILVERLLYNFKITDRSDLYRLPALLGHKFVPKDTNIIEYLNVCSDIKVVAAWELAAESQGNTAPEIYPLATAKDLRVLASRIALKGLMPNTAAEDKPSTSGVLPKLTSKDHEWITWKMESLGILGQHGLLAVVESEEYSKACPRSSAVVYGMIRSAVSNLVGHTDSHFLVDDMTVTKSGFTAWKNLTEQFEHDLFLDIQITEATERMTALTWVNNSLLVTFNMKYLSMKNTLDMLFALELKRGNSGRTMYSEFAESDWVNNYCTRLSHTEYQKYIPAVREDHRDDLYMAMAYIRYEVQKDQKSTGYASSRKNKRDRSGDEDQHDATDKPAPAKPRDITLFADRNDQFRSNAFRLVKDNKDLSEEDKKKVTAILNSAKPLTKGGNERDRDRGGGGGNGGRGGGKWNHKDKKKKDK
jgi:hypothetical protein